MEDLKTLQNKFMSLQKSGGGFKLSERTVVEIIHKITKRGKINLIHTSSGKEYVAEEKVTKEILDEIKRSGGRITKLELSKNLELPIGIIENKISVLLSKEKSLNYIEGKIITNQYLDSIAIEINQMLKSQGCVLISDISTKFDLSIEYFKMFIRDRIGAQIKAKLYATRLLTDEYVEKQKKRIRPALIASIVPINLTSLIDTYKLDDMIIEDIIHSLIDSGIVRGKLTANVYESEVYRHGQLSYIKGVMIQTDYIEYSKLKNIGILKNGKEFIQDNFKDDPCFEGGLFLMEYFISPTLRNHFEYTLLDNIAKENPTALTNIFLFDLYDEDITTLLESVNIPPGQIFNINMNLIPLSLIEGFVESCKPILKETASKQYNAVIAKQKEKEKKKLEEKSAKDKKGKKGPKKGKKIEDEVEEGESSEGAITLPPQLIIDLQQLFNKSKNLDELNNREETLKEVFENEVCLKLTQMYIQYINEFIKSKAQNVNDPKNLMNQIDNVYLYLRLVQKSCDPLMNLSTETNYQNAVKAINVHICKKDLASLFKDVLIYQLIHMKMQIDVEKLNNPNDRKAIISSFLDEELVQIFLTLNDHCQNRKFVQFMNFLQENAKNIAVSLSQLDRKKEKALIDQYSNELINSIDEKMILLGKTSKKDYVALAVDLCNSALLKKGYMIRLPYEIWTVGLFINLFGEGKLGLGDLRPILVNINDILNLPDDQFSDKQGEISDYLNKLFNSF